MRKKALVFIALGILGLAAANPVLNLLHHPYFPQLIGEAVWCIESDEKVLALTFDDGPNAALTPQIQDLLTTYDAQATFFVVGVNISDHSAIINQLYMDGHEIGNHSWDHPRLSFRSAGFIEEQINKTDLAIRSTGYEGSIPFRAPYGAKLLTLPYLLKQTGRDHILWNVDTSNWGSPENPTQEVTDLSSGDIVLLHTSSRYDVLGWLEALLKDYSSQGYRFVTVSDLLAYQEQELPSSHQCQKDEKSGLSLFNTIKYQSSWQLSQ